MNERRGGDDPIGLPLWKMLLRVSRCLESRLEGPLAEVGLSLAKLGVLDHLVKSEEPVPLTRLAEGRSCVKSNMTQLVDRLEADGLVKRLYDPSDRRIVLVAITKEGRRRYQLGGSVVSTQGEQLMSCFEPEEREHLAYLLEKFDKK